MDIDGVNRTISAIICILDEVWYDYVAPTLQRSCGTWSWSKRYPCFCYQFLSCKQIQGQPSTPYMAPHKNVWTRRDLHQYYPCYISYNFIQLSSHDLDELSPVKPMTDAHRAPVPLTLFRSNSIFNVILLSCCSQYIRPIYSALYSTPKCSCAFEWNAYIYSYIYLWISIAYDMSF